MSSPPGTLTELREGPVQAKDSWTVINDAGKLLS